MLLQKNEKKIINFITSKNSLFAHYKYIRHEKSQFQPPGRKNY